MADLIDFAIAKKVMGACPKVDNPPAKVDKPLPEKPKDTLQVRHNKAVAAIQYIQKLHFHKFTYPILASRLPKDTHSIDALYCNCFTGWGHILQDDELL